MVGLEYANLLLSHSALMPVARITLAHFAVSFATNFVNWLGAIGIGTPPTCASFSFMFGSASAAFISLFSSMTISVGTFFGAPKPVQGTASEPGTNSAIGGTPGSAASRVNACHS
jgi:hypothetical protein